MGEPKLSRKSYSGPNHPWQKRRIIEEADLRRKYAYKSKKELWKTASKLRRWREQGRSLISQAGTKQGELETVQLITKLSSYGLVPKDGKIEDVLNLKLENVLDRRLQSIVYRKGLANTIKQARQLVSHGHVRIGEDKVSSPSHLVKVSEESEVNVDIQVINVGGISNEEIAAISSARDSGESGSEPVKEE